MFNEWFGLLFVIITFSFLLLSYRLFGKTGLFVWIGISTVLANLQVVKTIEIFGLTATLGNAMYGSAFLVTDLLNDKYGKETAKKGVWLGFFTLFTMTIIMQLVLLFEPHAIDIAHESLANIFGLLPRIALGSLTAYLVSHYTDVYLFSFLKKKFPSDNHFWIRNNGSTMFSQLVDTAIFTSIAFLGVYPLTEWFEIFITTFIFKFFISIIATPFGYLARRFPEKNF